MWRIALGKLVLAEAWSEKITTTQGLSIVQQRTLQVAQPVRAAYRKTYDRGNWGHVVTFGATRLHENFRAAAEFMLTHAANLQTEKTLEMTCFENEGLAFTLFLKDVETASVQSVMQGCTTIHQYTFQGGEIAKK